MNKEFCYDCVKRKIEGRKKYWMDQIERTNERIAQAKTKAQKKKEYERRRYFNGKVDELKELEKSMKYWEKNL